MRTRTIIAASAAGICLATLGSALPAAAAPSSSSFGSVHQTASEARVAFVAELVSVTSTTASIAVTGMKTGGDITVTDGKGTTVTEHVYLVSPRLTITVPVTPGHRYDFAVTQTVSGQTTSPIQVAVDTDISSLERPTKASASITGGRFALRVSGVPFIPVEVRNIYGQVLATTPMGADGTVFFGGTASHDLTDQHYFVRQVFSDDIASEAVDVRVTGTGTPHDVAQPTFDVTERDGTTTITATRDDDTYAATLVLRDSDYKLFGQTLFHGKTASVSLPTPKAAQLWRLSENDSGDGPNRESVAKEIVLNEGAGSVKPEAPTVEKVDASGTTVVAQLETAKNAVVTVRDENGSVVAVRSAGASGHASVSIRNAGTSGHEYTVTQSTGSMESKPTPIDLP